MPSALPWTLARLREFVVDRLTGAAPRAVRAREFVEAHAKRGDPEDVRAVLNDVLRHRLLENRFDRLPVPDIPPHPRRYPVPGKIHARHQQTMPRQHRPDRIVPLHVIPQSVHQHHAAQRLARWTKLDPVQFPSRL